MMNEKKSHPASIDRQPSGYTQSRSDSYQNHAAFAKMRLPLAEQMMA